MVQRKQDPPSAFTAAVHAEIRGWMGKRNMSQRKLGELAGIPKSTLSRLIGTDVQPLNLNELESLCNVLGVSPQQVIMDAERTILAERRSSVEAGRPYLAVAPELTPQEMADAALAKKQDGYGLAARKMRDLKPGEEPGVEYYE